MDNITLKVKGMMCTGCENRIKNALGEIKEIDSVDANHDTGKVDIKLNNEISKEKIIEIIDDLGFEVIGE